MGTYTLQKKEFFVFEARIPDPRQEITTGLVRRVICADDVSKASVDHTYRDGKFSVITGTWPNDKEHILRARLDELAGKV